MATKRVYVYKDPGFFDSYKVFPPVIVIDQSDKFEIVNTTDHDAFVTIPDNTFQGAAIKDQKVTKKNKSDQKSPKAGPIGVEYKIKVDGHDAQGNSDPVIIIDM